MTEPLKPIAWDRIYPRCVWCDGENYVLAVLAYSAGEIPCAAVLGCGRYLPDEYRRTPNEHNLAEPKKLRAPGGKDGMYQVTCSCGKYQSGVYTTAAAALKPGREHVRAKS